MQNRVKSELQIQVLRLYREAWKFASTRPDPLRSNLRTHVRDRFEKNRDIPRIKFHQIEYQMRLGRNQLYMAKSTGIDNISFK
jgi:hypothetical protein